MDSLWLTDNALNTVPPASTVGANDEILGMGADGSPFRLPSVAIAGNSPSGAFIRGFDRQNPTSMPTVTYDASAHTCTVAPQSGQSSFYFYVGGKKFTKTTAQIVDWGTASGTYYFYFDSSGDLCSAEHSLITETSFVSNAICGLCYYNNAEGTVWGAPDEMHSVVMDASTHFRLHMCDGYKYSSGGEITGLVDAGATYTGISEGVHFDEDIVITTPAQTALYWMYRDGIDGAWKLSSSADTNVTYMGASYAYWNEYTGGAWQLTESTSSTDYIITYLLATNFTEIPLVKLVGQQVYPSRSDARKALKNNLHTLKLEGFPSTECEFQFAWISKRNGTLEDDGDGNAYIDLRGVNINAVD